MSLIQNIMFTIPKGAQKNLLITQGNTGTCLINRGNLVSRAFLFVEKGEHLIFVLLCKANLKY